MYMEHGAAIGMNRFRYASQSYGPLSENRAHQFAIQHALLHFMSGAVYSFIPKNACSTLRLSLAIANGCIANEAEAHWIHANNGTFRASLREAATAPYTFVVLRCPFKRLASVFLDKFVSKENDAWLYRDARRRTCELDDLTFADFVKSLANEPLRDVNIHWRPQVDFLLYEDYHDWFCLEDFAYLPDKLQSRIGLSIKDARAMTRHGADTASRKIHVDCSQVPVWKLAEGKRAGRLPTYQALYTPELFAIVASLYADDIKLMRSKGFSHKLLAST